MNYGRVLNGLYLLSFVGSLIFSSQIGQAQTISQGYIPRRSTYTRDPSRIFGDYKSRNKYADSALLELGDVS